MSELHRLLVRALKKTEGLWPALSKAYALVHQAAHVLANHEDERAQAVRERYQKVLTTMREQQASLGPLSEAISTFLKVTESYWPGLFHCYDVPDLPRTNNELEHCFGSVRYGERRASGRRGAIAALVVRGPVRVLTALALRRQCFLPRALVLKDQEAWSTMREQLIPNCVQNDKNKRRKVAFLRSLMVSRCLFFERRLVSATDKRPVASSCASARIPLPTWRPLRKSFSRRVCHPRKNRQGKSTD